MCEAVLLDIDAALAASRWATIELEMRDKKGFWSRLFGFSIASSIELEMERALRDARYITLVEQLQRSLNVRGTT